MGERLARLQLLEAIVDPNRRTSPGYGSTRVFLDDGTVHIGRVVEEGDALLVLQDADGELTELELARVEERLPALSAMPEELGAALSREEMRDLLEYLSRL